MATLLYLVAEFLVGMVLDPSVWVSVLKGAHEEGVELARWNRSGL